ncbi:MAG: PqqD family protein [Gammaproteobacteria bacterium]|nr:PqqD family protein [Gammaproteobacteria bacterium]
MTNKEITLQSVIIRNPEINFTNMCGEIVMMSIDQGEFYGLDDIASDIWHRLEHSMDVQALCNDLALSYGINIEQCFADTLPFLREMAGKGLVRMS